MNRVELYIDNQRVELFKDEEITITQSLKKLQDIETVFSDYTQDFSVPASKANQKIFKHLYRGDVLTSLDVRKRTNAEIRMNGQLFKKGYVVFRDAQVVDGKVVSHKLYFVGGLGHLKQKLGDTKISQLIYDNISATQDYESVKQGLQRSVDQIDSTLEKPFDIVYSLITATGGHYYSEDSTEPDVDEFPKNIAGSPSPTPSGLWGLNYQELKPSIRMNSIIDAIETTFEQQGVVFSNDFLKRPVVDGEFDNKEWMNLFMLMHNKKGKISSNEQSSIKLLDGWYIASTAFPAFNSYVTILNDGMGIFYFNKPTGIFGAGKLKDITYTITPSNPNTEYEVFKRNVQVTGSEYETITNGKVTGTQTIVQSEGFNIEAYGERYYAIVDSSVTLDVDVQINWKNTGVANDVTFSSSTTLGTEQNLDISRLLPDMSVLDFLKGVFKLFNLIAYEDENGVIVVKQYDAWRSEKKTVDITKYVNDSKYRIDLKVPYNAIKFDYKENEYNSFPIRSFEAEYGVTNPTNLPYGSVELREDSIESSDKSYFAKTPFELLEYRRLYHSTTEAPSNNDYNLATQIQLGELVDNQFEPIGGKGLIYYPILSFQNGTMPDVNSGIRINDGTTGEAMTSFNIPSNTATLSAFKGDDVKALPFGVYRDSWIDYVYSDRGMYHRYHFDFLSPVFNVKNKSYVLDVYLPSHILVNLELNDDIVYKNKRYRINLLKTNLQSGKSSIEIVGYDTTPASQLIPADTGAVPVITILGDNPASVDVGATYTDSGATAVDTEDGDITADITDNSASIDTSSAGSQVVTYTVEDSDGNIATATRTVNVVENAIPVVTDYSINNINLTTATMDFEATSGGGGITECDFYVKKQGDPDPSSPTQVQIAGGVSPFSGTFVFEGRSGNTYETWMIAKNSANSTQSSTVTVVIF